ncbi:N-acyl-L-homoserine lactone synthetase [Rhizobium ruizarguesonis]
MQVLAFSAPRTVQEAHLLHLHFQLRARVFADRLGWEVDVSAGCESDGFDALRPTYVLAIAETGQLAGVREAPSYAWSDNGGRRFSVASPRRST